MSIAPRETKCLQQLPAAPGQSRLGHLVKTASCGLDRRRVAERAARRRVRRRGRSLCSATCGAGRDHLGDHVAGAQHDHLLARRGCPCATMSSSLCSVAMRDRHAADLDRLEHRVGAQVAELADVPHDLLRARHGGRRRELPRHRPARVAPDRAQPALQLEIVDLHDHAVDLEVELAAALLPLQALRDHLVLAAQQLDVAVDRGSRARAATRSASEWRLKDRPSVTPTW